MTRIRAVIFDLDNCLAAADEAGEELFAPAFEAIRMANHGRLSRQQLDEAFADCWRHALDRVAEKHRFSEEMLAGLRRPGCAGEGCREADPRHVEIPAPAGEQDRGARRARPARKDIFREIVSRRGWRAEEVLVVGDNAESEIAAGNELGMPTVQTLRPGVPYAPSARLHIKSLAELLSYA